MIAIPLVIAGLALIGFGYAAHVNRGTRKIWRQVHEINRQNTLNLERIARDFCTATDGLRDLEGQ